MKHNAWDGAPLRSEASSGPHPLNHDAIKSALPITGSGELSQDECRSSSIKLSLNGCRQAMLNRRTGGFPAWISFHTPVIPIDDILSRSAEET
jgi:hypothetical protein